MGAARFGSTFYVRMALAMLLLTILGFTPAISHRLSSGGLVTPVLMLHGSLFVAWLCLFLVQAQLAGSRNLARHRQIGALSPVLAGLMVLSCILITVETFHGYKDNIPGFTRENFIILPIMDGSLFAVYYTLAFLKRRQAETHKHLMLLTTVMIMDPAVARLGGFLGHPAIGIVLHFALLAALILYDRQKLGRVHRTTLVALPVLATYYAAFFLVGPSAGWAAFVGWLMG